MTVRLASLPSNAKGSLAPPSLSLFHFECEVDDEPHTPSNTRSSCAATSVREHLSLCQKQNGVFTSQLSRDCGHFRRSDPEAREDAVVLAVRLAAVGYAVSVRTALGPPPQRTSTAPASSVFKNLRHEFLCVQGAGDSLGVELIIEPHFREQFAIPQATADYATLLDSLPLEYVGTASRLRPVVQVLCAEMAASFEARGLTLPPWRTAQSIISKWMPTRKSDTPISSPGSSCTLGSSPVAWSAGVPHVGGSNPFSSSPSFDAAAALVSHQLPACWRPSMCALPEGADSDSSSDDDGSSSDGSSSDGTSPSPAARPHVQAGSTAGWRGGILVVENSPAAGAQPLPVITGGTSLGSSSSSSSSGGASPTTPAAARQAFPVRSLLSSRLLEENCAVEAVRAVVAGARDTLPRIYTVRPGHPGLATATAGGAARQQ